MLTSLTKEFYHSSISFKASSGCGLVHHQRYAENRLISPPPQLSPHRSAGMGQQLDRKCKLFHYSETFSSQKRKINLSKSVIAVNTPNRNLAEVRTCSDPVLQNNNFKSND